MNRKTMLRALFVSACVLLLASPCAAQSATDAAREVFDEAARQFEAHNYALALRGFQDAHQRLVAAHHERAGYTLYNIGRCYEELGRLAEARDAFQRFLSESDENAPHRDEVADRIRDLQARIDIGGEVQGTGDEGRGWRRGRWWRW